MVLVIVAREKATTEAQCIIEAAETVRKGWLVFERFELSLGKRVVVADVRAAVAFCDVQLCMKAYHGLRLHCRTPV